MVAIAKSTATIDQENGAALLIERPEGATTDDLRAIGIYQTSARIFGLRARGYVIRTELYDGIGADGHFHKRMARYHMVSRPLPLDPKSQALECRCSPEVAAAHSPPVPSPQLHLEAMGGQQT